MQIRPTGPSACPLSRASSARVYVYVYVYVYAGIYVCMRAWKCVLSGIYVWRRVREHERERERALTLAGSL